MENPHRFDRLLEEQIPRLRRYARRLSKNHARADDLVQICLMRAVAKQHLWQAGTNLGAWLCTILRNQYSHEVRDSARRGVHVSMADMKVEIPDYRMDPQAGLIIRDLVRALEKLPAEKRRAIGLVGYYGLTYEEAAAHEQIPIGTIRSRLHNGRKLLQEFIE